MLIKIILVALLLLVVYNLFRALFIMIKNDEQSPKMSTFLGKRLFFSVAVILFILLLLLTGVITPNPRPY